MAASMTGTFHNPFKSWSPLNKIFFAGEGICHSYDEFGRPYTGTVNYRGQTFTSRLLWTPDYHIKGRTAMSQEVEKGTHTSMCGGKVEQLRRRPVMFVQRHHGAKFVVIHMHGNGCDVGDMQPLALEQAYTWEAHVILPEYPGYAEAPGRSSVKDVEWAVMSAALFALTELQVPPSRIIVFGYSIGSGAACMLARSLCEMDMPPAALMLHAPYTSLRDMAVHFAGAIGNTTFNRFKTKRNLPYVTAPVLIFHGDRDEVIPFQMGINNFKSRERCPYPTEFFQQQGCTHNEYDPQRHIILPGLAFLRKHVIPKMADRNVVTLQPYPQEFNNPPEDIEEIKTANVSRDASSKAKTAANLGCMCGAFVIEMICGSVWLCWRGLKRNVVQKVCPTCVKHYKLHIKGDKGPPKVIKNA
mmetsp:Transcript_98768/g.171157  ORF Transcript_98768/g.171157 Transcript_98768/m.171157 type:complete len:413 (-) Transcript_98768:120-1358(-)